MNLSDEIKIKKRGKGETEKESLKKMVDFMAVKTFSYQHRDRDKEWI